MSQIKFYLNTIMTKLKTINQENIDNSFVPNPSDIENVELKKLARRLKGNSEKETLTNILEWEDRNIKYWYERWPLFYVIQWSLLIFIFLLLFSGATLFLAFFPPDIITQSIARSIYPDLILIVFYYLIALLGVIVLMAVYLRIRYNRLREKPVNEKISKVVCDTWRKSLPIDKILRYRLAVCRDYARLTASLLFNIYPDVELYFFRTSTHAVAGININNKIYIFDQHLPISTLDNWLIKNKGAEIYASKLKRDSEGKIIEVTLNKLNKNEKIKENLNGHIPYINTDKLTDEITKTLEIKQSSYNEKICYKIELYNYSVYYGSDEIINYSLLRAIKNKLESEFCDKIDRISKINISQKEKDLIVMVYL